ncbi:MAG: adenylate/guanylate cyclase domain-containing response regulator [Flavobacteriales bacterium]|nr:adenylate/guanylate cyclase domain-containing response regulator [Flavobacteriales bacterium]
MMEEKYNILIVDDDEKMLCRWEGILLDPSRNIIKAYSGHEAMRMLVSRHVHLVITDIDMPVKNGPQMNGLELIKHIRSKAKFNNISIIFTTDDHDSLEDIVHGLEDGAIDYLIEPLHPAITKAKVATHQNLFEKRRLLRLEREKTEQLLRNILPEHTIDELKVEGRTTARHYNQATVMFTDFVNFTVSSEHREPKLVVEQLNYYFSYFDDVISEYYLEKIKTIGDAYMAAGGVPIRNKFNPIFCCLAALKLRDFVAKELHNEATAPWEVRIGINTGPLVAGVVGKMKYQYDIWGDTVNTASRLEGASVPGKINISKSTYELIKDYFDCEYRGDLEIKSKGHIDMYFLNHILLEYAEIDNSSEPNQKFLEILQEH